MNSTREDFESMNDTEEEIKVTKGKTTAVMGIENTFWTINSQNT